MASIEVFHHQPASSVFLVSLLLHVRWQAAPTSCLVITTHAISQAVSFLLAGFIASEEGQTQIIDKLARGECDTGTGRQQMERLAGTP